MSDEVIIEAVNDVYVRIQAEPSVKMELSDHFTFKVPGAEFMPSYRNKIWDGKIRLLNLMTGMIYRGLVPYILNFCNSREYEVTVDKGVVPDNEVQDTAGYDLAKEFESVFTPREYQNNAVVHALKHERALLLSPTASGKSFIIYLLTRFYTETLDTKVLIVVPTTSLVEQMASDFTEYNGGQELDVHKIRGGVDKNVDAQITITTWQSVYKLRKDWFAKFGVVIGDEAHLFKSKSLTSVLEKMPDCRYRYGFTGTLDGTQTHRLVLEGLFGSVFEVTKTKDLIDDKTLAEFGITALVLEYPDEIRKLNKNMSYQEEIDWIVRNDARNKYIRNLAHGLKGNTLILFQFVEKHGKVLAPLLEKEGKVVHFIHGSISAEDREEVRRVAESSDNNIILASYGTFSTGVNIKRLDNIIFASPSKSKIRNLQSIGRVLRKGNGADKATLYDIVDDLQWKSKKNFAVKHFMERVQIYNDEGFEYSIYNIKMKG
jgi:superfamily II DNA or RNA helicase